MNMPLEKTSFLFGPNATFVAEIYSRYLDDPDSVDPAWARYFTGLHDEAGAVLEDLRGASWAPRSTQVVGADGAGGALAAAVPALEEEPAIERGAAPDLDQIRAATLESIRALMMIRAYRVRGHLIADLDPLGLEGRDHHPELDPTTYGFEEEDDDREIFINYVLGLESATLGEILTVLRQTYCCTIGVEFMHIQDPEQKAWIQERVEGTRNQPRFTPEEKRAILEQVTAAEAFERFLDRKYTGTKRFGLEGAESMIPALERILVRGAELGVEEVILGMPHRGRLNVLANVIGKPWAAIFSEFQGRRAYPEDVQGSGDVKYHLGTSSDREINGRRMHLSLTANPSHLEAVDPVVLGKVRAKQTRRSNMDGGEDSREKVMGLLLHGDAAFAGQGLVAETLDLSELKGYRTGGTIHFIVNNQIGFTTSPSYSRSSPYCSDLAKGIQAPIFHINGDDPEAVVYVTGLATEFRQRFKKDVVLDMFCYRRHGHNESDEPAFTQPLMYKTISGHRPVGELYAEKLIAEGVVTAEEAEAMATEYRRRLDEAFEAAPTYKPNKADWLEGSWSGLEVAQGEDRRGDTAVAVEKLRELGLRMIRVPERFNAHGKIARLFGSKRKMLESGEGIDWATAEALAFGTLLVEGTPLRLSGQDSGRGTFSQRHAVLIDQETEDRFIPLNCLSDDQALFEVIDSPLSEASVLGFEYGYSLAQPHALVMWEAQFGDFSNGAQVIIDQFIASGEGKWLRMSGLVMLLPHGHDGQGPEHSSGRLERFLQLCAQDNIQVVNCTTPANYFHVLRRQARRPFRKPLVVMTPKSLLRHKLCVSSLEEMGPGTSFHRVLYDDKTPCPDGDVKRVILCSGKVYYDLLEERAKRSPVEIAILRLEQLYPFPYKALIQQLYRFPWAEVVWCQEEPVNMGAWTFVAPRIEEILGRIESPYRRPTFVGRPEAAAPATGLLSGHLEEQKRLVDEALTLAERAEA
jgi:2-oxoglutarate dehydrogenase E1 component